MASPYLSPPVGWPIGLVVIVVALAASGRSPGEGGLATVAPRLVAIAASGALAGLGAGEMRLGATEPEPLDAGPGQRVEAEGFIASTPKRSYGEVRVPVELGAGRVVAVLGEPTGEIPVGSRWRLEGVLREPEEWRAEAVLRAGAALELQVREAERVEGTRSGVTGVLDGVRARAERALVAGTDPDRAALLRGFVLGQDDLIDPLTRERFKRSGLAHLLAVSGQNVMLLAVLVGGVLIVVGTGLRTRLAVIVAVIVIYVPVAGAGPSIQRAGVMGVAAIVALLAARRSDRIYLPLLAAAATLLLDPRVGADVGWQLSFAAVIGISLWAASLRDLFDAGAADRSRLGRWLRRPLAEGAGLTIAATIATAPLLAHHFEQISVASLLANLLVLPAVAPVMWLGMLTGLLGQLPAIPTEPLGWLAGMLAAYVDRIAALAGDPGWAVLEANLASPAALALIYAAIVAGVAVAIAAARRRRGLIRIAGAIGAPALACLLLAAVALLGSGGGREAPASGSLRVTVHDVGQGDAVMLETSRGLPVLVDGGPPGADLADRLRADGIERLAGVVATHDQLDHVGGLAAVLERLEVDRLVLARRVPSLEAIARAAGVRIERVGEPRELRLGGARLSVLSPRLDERSAEDPNDDSLVLMARHGGYRVLLTGDAESPALGDPGPIDLLKVAHHGSEDAGLDAFVERAVPRLAVVSAGRDNSYGHPAPETLSSLADHGVCLLRTDLDGSVSVELGPAGIGAKLGEPGALADRPGCAELAAGGGGRGTK